VSEADLYGPIQAAYSHGDTRLLRINAAVAWQGTVVERSATRLVLLHPRPVRLATAGVSDFVGITEGGLFVALEVKSERGRPTPEQAAFLDTITRLGGRAGVARSVQEAGRIIRGDALT
jgi:hypothetical protein